MSSQQDSQIEKQSQDQQSQFQEDFPKKKKKITKKTKKPQKKSKQSNPKQPKAVKAKIQNKKQKPVIQIQPLRILTPDQYSKLLNCVNVPIFSLNYQTHLIKILDIHDGDTITGAIFLQNDIKKYKIRIDGIDTPQVHDKIPELKQFSAKVRDIVSTLKNKIVKGQLGKFDKYGRLLAKIWFKNETQQIQLSQWLIKNKLAKAYSGKTKQIFSIQDYKQIKDKIDKIKLPNAVNY